MTIAYYAYVSAHLTDNSNTAWVSVQPLATAFNKLYSLYETFSIIMPPPPYKIWRCLSIWPFVRLSVARLNLNSRTERPKEPKFRRMEARHTQTCNPWTYLEVKRSKVKVTRSTNVHTVIAHQYSLNGKAFELQTWYTDGAQRPVLRTSAVTFHDLYRHHQSPIIT